MINILIVDDNKNNIFTLHTLIKEYINVHILEADSGSAALKLLMKEPVDLIILDVQMPHIDGFETAQLIRTRQKMQHIPIVFLTAAYKSEEFRQKGFAIGAADYLTKPIDTHQLIARIKSYVRFIEQDHQHKIDLEYKVQERTKELLNARNELEQRVEERTAELLLAKDKAEQTQKIAEKANLAKSQFLANMSHELRTPLNAIIGYSEMLQEDAEDLGQTDFLADLQKIQAAGKHLLGLINDVLDLSKIEAGKIDLFHETFDLMTVINDIISTVQPLVKKQNNILKTVIDDNLGEMQTDLTKLRQILLNLLSNAAKFTEQGTIRFKVSHQIRKDGSEWIIFCVADDGIGMTDEQQERIFQPFIQADGSTTRRYGGTGLGLAITKQFVQIMGGMIQVNSELGQGSTLTIYLPAQVMGTPIDTPNTLAPLKMGTILVIDDDASQREWIKRDMSQLGYNIAVANNGDEGIQMAYKLSPHTIILSVNMSDMEGWRVLSTLRNNAFFVSIRVILIAKGTDENQWYAINATDCIDKSLVRSQLAAILKKYHIVDHSTALAMVVDDDKVWRANLLFLLEEQGWHVLQAKNGQDALEQLENKTPTFILLDINMPVMDGFEFISRLKKHEEWCSIPILVLTAKNLTAEEQARLNLHAKTILQKDVYNQNGLILYFHQLISE